MEIGEQFVIVHFSVHRVKVPAMNTIVFIVKAPMIFIWNIVPVIVKMVVIAVYPDSYHHPNKNGYPYLQPLYFLSLYNCEILSVYLL